jgi:hypothetical protein
MRDLATPKSRPGRPKPALRAPARASISATLASLESSCPVEFPSPSHSVSSASSPCRARLPRPGPDAVAKHGRRSPPRSASASLQWREPTDSGDVVAPFSLTSSEGIGLELLSLRSRAVVADPLAFTELHMVFQNPQDRQIEGRFEISLPPGAAISRFAMKIDGDWQEAEVVELQAARRAYEDALHRRQDPALLEKNAGNRFSARVFPIPARAVKEIIVSYSEALPSNSEPYRLLLRGLPTLKDLDVDVVVPRASGPEHLTLREQNFMPQKDLELAMGRRSAEVGLRFERLAVARIAPDLKLPRRADLRRHPAVRHQRLAGDRLQGPGRPPRQDPRGAAGRGRQ